jgi:hypothetical protein
MKRFDIFNRRKLTALLTLFLVSAGLFAQTNFSGKWELNESKSKFGEGGGPGGAGGRPPMGASSMTVAQDIKILTVDQIMTGRNGEEFETTSKYNLDGTLSENTFMMDRTRKSVLTWSDDKKSILISSTMNFERDGESREIKTSEKWSLSNDGKILFIESTRPTREGETRTTIFAYDKK